jgi:transcriptional antiterminator NusG
MTAARWYVVNVYAGLEKKVVQAIEEQAAKKGLSNYFEEMLVPSESVVEIKKGQKVNVEKQYFPGYLLIKMILNDETWHLVRNIPRVSSFLGAKGKPSPISQAEVNRILNQVKTSIEKPRQSLHFEVGENIRVTDGPFSTFQGVVEEVDQEKGRLKVSVMIFGRPTPVELEFSQVERS